MKELGIRTINRVEKSTTHANSNVTINIARARLGLTDEAIANASIEAKKAAGGALFVERRTPDHRFRVGFDPED